MAGSQSDGMERAGLLARIGPGLLVAATGVGAGDLMTASLAGSAVGVRVVWAAVAGAVVKWFLNEGIARWQMATGSTLLEGWVRHLGRWVQWVFLVYLAGWTVLTGGALLTACGVAGAGLLPLGGDFAFSKIVWGALHSAAAVLLVVLGGFALFEKLMAFFIALMFCAVVATAALSGPVWRQVLAGFVPVIPAGGLGWVLGLLGGVGGTVTLLSYGYWIREAGRRGRAGHAACRVDLGVGYVMTALFGVAMVIVGSRVVVEGSGATVAVQLAEQLERSIGLAGRVVFQIGFWGAVFSSTLGVWQSVPYMFADFVSLRRGRSEAERSAEDLTRSGAYRGYLVGIATLSLPMLWTPVKTAQLAYAVLGAMFMPLLALTLLLLNNRSQWVGEPFKNGWLTNVALLLTLGFFLYVGIVEANEQLLRLLGV